MSQEWKRVPVELLERLISATVVARGAGSPTQRDAEAILAAPAPHQADVQPVECNHEWTDDGLFTLVCTVCGTQENHDPKWRDMDSAPKDGTLLRLLVEFEEHSTQDEDQSPTIGANNFDNDAQDEWLFAGWCWTHDHWRQGKGTPVGWLPLIDTHADTGEVERLNTVVEQQKNLITSLRAELVESHSLTDDSLRAQLADTEQSRRSWFDLSQDLEKRLAERDALAVRLTEVQADSHELFGDRELFAAQRDKARNLLKRAENFVSEIAATGRPGAIELESDIRSLYLPIDAEHVRPEFVFSNSPDGCAAEAKFLRSLKAESSQHD